MEPQALPRRLRWVKDAFSRTLVLNDGNREIGKLSQNWFSSDVDAELRQTRLRFDVRGFLQRRVEILDVNRANAVVGTIAFGWAGSSATLTLPTGETYVWKRKNWLTREWGLVRDLPGTDNDPEVVHFTRLREFFGSEGEINLLDASPQADLVVLTGLFVWLYFRQQAAAGAAVAGAAAAG